MNDETPKYNSFILRIWWKQDQQRWYGWVQHVHSGQTTTIRGLDELDAFIRRVISPPFSQPVKGLK